MAGRAAIRHASLIEGDLADGHDAKAKEHQAEGLAFWRVVEAYMVPAGADADAMDAIFNLDNPPGANGFGDDARAALEPAWDALGIAASDIGSLQKGATRIGESPSRGSGVIPALVRCAHGPLGPRPRAV